MILNMSCPRCGDRVLDYIRAQGPGTSGALLFQVPPSIPIELGDGNAYNFNCSVGHSCHFVLQNQRFEILFDLGACALIDGYSREAVLSFAASLERFREFWLRCVLRNHGITEQMFIDMWRHLRRQSERQLGAYLALYTATFTRPPAVLSDSPELALRNDVAHNGKIPCRAEALRFGNAVYAVVAPQIRELRQTHRGSVLAILNEHVERATGTVLPGTQTASINVRTALSASRDDTEDTPFSLETEVAEIHRIWSDWSVKRF